MDGRPRIGEMMSLPIADGVYQVGGAGFTADEDAAVYLIQGDGAAALVDGGCGSATDRLFDNIRDTGTRPGDIQWLLLTHCHMHFQKEQFLILDTLSRQLLVEIFRQRLQKKFAECMR